MAEMKELVKKLTSDAKDLKQESKVLRKKNVEHKDGVDRARPSK